MDLGSTQSWLNHIRQVEPYPQDYIKIHPHIRWGTRAKDGSTYPYTAYLGAETPYIHIRYGFVKHSICEALQARFEAQPWFDHIRQGWALPQVTKNPPLIYVGYQPKGGSIYPFTAYLSAETLYICNMDL